MTCLHQRHRKDGFVKTCTNEVYRNELCVSHYYHHLKLGHIPAHVTLHPWKGNSAHWRDVYLTLE